MDNTYGSLYICATPIGNLGDITLRVLETLKTVDFIATEDTRHSLKLLNHFGIKNKLISYHEHNKNTRTEEIISLIKQGKSVALISDAGMPIISDPGDLLVSKCRENNIAVTVCPGANAALTALILSGFCARAFVFEGFLPSEKKLRQKKILQIKDEARTTILYESPHRLRQLLKELEVLGERNISIARELTKIYEEVINMTVSETIEHFREREPRGEYVILIEGNTQIQIHNFWDDMTEAEHVKHYEDSGLSQMEAIKKAAKDRKVPKSAIYGIVKKH